MPKGFAETPIIIGGLFVKRPTVHTATQFWLKPEDAKESVGRSHSSDEVAVMAMERRASVIQSNYFKTTPMLSGEDDERNDKVITGK